jgi:hypothetical protein
MPTKAKKAPALSVSVPVDSWAAGDFFQQPRHSTDLGEVQDHEGQDDCPGHGQNKLEGVGDGHSPETGQGRIEGRERQGEGYIEHDLAWRDAEHPFEDGGHGQVHPADDDGVDEDAQVEGPKPSQKRGGLAGVAKLNKLHVGQDAGAPPEACEEEDRQHAAEDEIPPEPVARDAVFRHEFRHRQRGVCRKGRGDHGCAGKPPGEIAPREKELLDARAGAAGEVNADRGAQQEV